MSSFWDQFQSWRSYSTVSNNVSLLLSEPESYWNYSSLYAPVDPHPPHNADKYFQVIDKRNQRCVLCFI